MPRLCTVFGEEWALNNVVPRIISLYKDQANYMHRLTAFYGINELVEASIATPDPGAEATGPGLTTEVRIFDCAR